MSTSVAMAVDPGLATGYAVWEDNNVVETGELNFEDFLARTEEWTEHHIRQGHSVYFVVEQFIINQQTAKNSQAPWSLEVIGALRWLAYRAGAHLVFQTPALAKSFATDKKLVLTGMMPTVKGEGHCVDACRHLLVYMVQQGVIEPAELINGDC